MSTVRNACPDFDPDAVGAGQAPAGRTAWVVHQPAGVDVWPWRASGPVQRAQCAIIWSYARSGWVPAASVRRGHSAGCGCGALDFRNSLGRAVGRQSQSADMQVGSLPRLVLDALRPFAPGSTLKLAWWQRSAARWLRCARSRRRQHAGRRSRELGGLASWTARCTALCLLLWSACCRCAAVRVSSLQLNAAHRSACPGPHQPLTLRLLRGLVDPAGHLDEAAPDALCGGGPHAPARRESCRRAACR